MKLTPTAEQQQIIDASMTGDNLCIIAVAGAGKTTTLCMLAEELSSKRCQLITYSRALKDDILLKGPPSNVSVDTFHSFASKCYGAVIHNDELMKNHTYNSIFLSLKPIDVLMIDEVQDMTPLYFALIQNILKQFPLVQVILVGDPRQTIREYVGARAEFLVDCERIFKCHTGNTKIWRHLKLTKSYRLTPANAEFVNKHVYCKDVIVSGNTRSPNIRPTYVSLKSAYDLSSMLDVITQKCRKYGHDNVQVLVASVKSRNSPVRKLAETMSHIPHYICAEGEIPNPKNIAGKLVFRTFASCKGLQCKCIVLIGYDETYFSFYEKQWQNQLCVPNILSVAATRAIDELVIIAEGKHALRTIELNTLRRHVTVLGKYPERKPTKAIGGPQKISVTDFVKHKHIDIIEAATELLLIEQVANGVSYDLPPCSVEFQTTKYKTISEPVSLWYGELIPLLMKFKRQGATPWIPQHYTEADVPPKLLSMASRAEKGTTDIKCLTAALVVNKGVVHIMRQIDHYDWIDESVINYSMDILEQHLPRGGTFEVPLPKTSIYGTNIELDGRADYIHDNIVYELKYGDAAVCEHFLQLSCYLAMRGGGIGYLVIYPRGEVHKVTLNAADARKFLTTLAADTRKMPPIDTVIAKFAINDTSNMQMSYDEEAEDDEEQKDDLDWCYL